MNDKLKKKMKLERVTQAKIAAELGISQSYVSRWPWLRRHLPRVKPQSQGGMT